MTIYLQVGYAYYANTQRPPTPAKPKLKEGIGFFFISYLLLATNIDLIKIYFDNKDAPAQ